MKKHVEKEEPKLMHVSVGFIVSVVPDTPRGTARADFGLNKNARSGEKK